jgi:hypothetical protein
MKCTFLMFIQTNYYRLRHKWQTRPLVREGAPQRQESNFLTEGFKSEIISGHKPRMASAPRYIDWLTVRSNVTINYPDTSSRQRGRPA